MPGMTSMHIPRELGGRWVVAVEYCHAVHGEGGELLYVNSDCREFWGGTRDEAVAQAESFLRTLR